jgi:hypothetical protein
MDQQSGGGDAEITVAKTAGLLIAARQFGNEILDGVEQKSLLERLSLSPQPIFMHAKGRRNRCRGKVQAA